MLKMWSSAGNEVDSKVATEGGRRREADKGGRKLWGGWWQYQVVSNARACALMWCTRCGRHILPGHTSSGHHACRLWAVHAACPCTASPACPRTAPCTGSTWSRAWWLWAHAWHPPAGRLWPHSLQAALPILHVFRVPHAHSWVALRCAALVAVPLGPRAACHWGSKSLDMPHPGMGQHGTDGQDASPGAFAAFSNPTP